MCDSAQYKPPALGAPSCERMQPAVVWLARGDCTHTTVALQAMATDIVHATHKKQDVKKRPAATTPAPSCVFFFFWGAIKYGCGPLAPTVVWPHPNARARKRLGQGTGAACTQANRWYSWVPSTRRIQGSTHPRSRRPGPFSGASCNAPTRCSPSPGPPQRHSYQPRRLNSAASYQCPAQPVPHSRPLALASCRLPVSKPPVPVKRAARPLHAWASAWPSAFSASIRSTGNTSRGSAYISWWGACERL